MEKTGERINPELIDTKEEYILYLRHLFAYYFVKKEILKGSLVLEVGFGEGYGTSLLAKSGFDIIGLDVNEETIKEASQKYQTQNCHFVWYDGKKIPFEAETFDVVVSFQVIEHLQDDVGFISEISRVLKKDGKFFLTTPNRLYRLKPNEKPRNPFHVREYSPRDFQELLNKVFTEAKVFGIRGTEEVQNIEIKRVKKPLTIKLDPLNLRRFLPSSFRKNIRKFLSSQEKESIDYIKRYNLNDFYVIEDHLEESLDLLGICKK
jgi:2-polyprenyl-3-methyl-5-hydroxy-6-metoxy-1,4-benzoquinol methylase